MSWIDWLIVVIPLAFVIGVGLYSRRFVRGVADFLSAGRVCGRYVICVGDVAGMLAIITLVSYVEVHYKTGFALGFWGLMISPLGIILGLLGYCTYRFRETKAMSLGQFLEMRYNRKLRIFGASLRSLSEVLANMIMPAVAARFFIYFLDLPQYVSIFGIKMHTFMVLVVFCTAVAVGLICMGGTLALIITDAVQGMLFYPLIAAFVIFILYKFSWSNDVIPVMTDRVPGESFINPFDVSKLRDFNLFMIFLWVVRTVLHRASWIGSGASTAARTPHEQKMAGVLGAWRWSITMLFYVLVAIAIITVMNHKKWAPEAKVIRDSIASTISQELISDDAKRTEFNKHIAEVPEQIHEIGIDPPLSQEHNLDTPLLTSAHKELQKFYGDAQGNEKFQEFRTLYHQMMMGKTMRHILPRGLLGMFLLLMIMAMISTDDSRIYSSAMTISQDVIMPLRKKPFTTKQHLWLLRGVSIGIGIIFCIGSIFMSQLDYIQLFITIMTSMWLGGCGPVMIFGLYSRFGNAAGAFASLISGMFLSLGGILVQRNWAASIYPWLDRHDWVEPVGNFLVKVSAPFNPIIEWKMDAVKFPINSYEIYFITMLVSLILYCVVSWMTQKEPFNLERMLHRGKYNLDGINKEKLEWSFRTFFIKMLGITKEFSKGDKVISWSVFIYSFVLRFMGFFLLVLIWNGIKPWPMEWWGKYFFITALLVPGIAAAISTFWFGIGGYLDLRRLFRDLRDRMDDPLDDGRVEGHVSLADKAKFEQLEKEKNDNSAENKGTKKA